jgi:hypothetical protein
MRRKTPHSNTKSKADMHFEGAREHSILERRESRHMEGPL